jgi:hypothetical protein
MDEAVLNVTVCNKKPMSISEPLGRIDLCPSASGRSRQHWEDMLAAKGRPIAQWHVLADPKCVHVASGSEKKTSEKKTNPGIWDNL